MDKNNKDFKRILNKLAMQKVLYCTAITLLWLVMWNAFYLLQADTTIHGLENGIKLGANEGKTYFDCLMLSNRGVVGINFRSLLVFSVVFVSLIVSMKIGFWYFETEEVFMEARIINSYCVERLEAKELLELVSKQLKVHNLVTVAIVFFIFVTMYIFSYSNGYVKIVKNIVAEKPVVLEQVYKNVVIKSVSDDGEVTKFIQISESEVIDLNDKLNKEGKKVDTSTLKVLDKTLKFSHIDDGALLYELIE